MNPIHPDSMGGCAVGGTAHDQQGQSQRGVSQRASCRPLTLGSGRGRPVLDCGHRTLSMESPSAGKVNSFGREVESGSERRRGFGAGILTARQSPISSHARSIGRSRGCVSVDLRGRYSSVAMPSSIIDRLSASSAAACALASGVVPFVTDEARLSVSARRAAWGGDTTNDRMCR